MALGDNLIYSPKNLFQIIQGQILGTNSYLTLSLSVQVYYSKIYDWSKVWHDVDNFCVPLGIRNFGCMESHQL